MGRKFRFIEFKAGVWIIRFYFRFPCRFAKFSTIFCFELISVGRPILVISGSCFSSFLDSIYVGKSILGLFIFFSSISSLFSHYVSMWLKLTIDLTLAKQSLNKYQASHFNAVTGRGWCDQSLNWSNYHFSNIILHCTDY